MAFHDWNCDGKKNYADNAIEMMILDDIEAEEAKNKKDMSYENYTPEWGVGYSEKNAYSKGNKLSNEEVDKQFQGIKIAILIIWGIAAIGILMINVISLFAGYVSWLGLIVSIVVLILIVKSFKKTLRKLK